MEQNIGLLMYYIARGRKNEKTLPKEVIVLDGLAEPAGAFSPAIKVGNILLISGQVAHGREWVTATVREQTTIIMERIGKILKKAGGSYDNLVSVNIFLSNMDDWPAMNEIYKTYFTDGKYPTGTVIPLPLTFEGESFKIGIQAMAILI